jgi:hypothetical protein
LDEIVAGIPNGHEPVRKALDQSFRRIMIGLAFLLVEITVNIILPEQRLRK